ncbi:MAG: type I-U CRISPR-associated protein Cas7 [Planctomycetes bacterium]|nr:type I-U CRISPR-associated protein Cas7 [Planctomycetota bacterium]
MPKFSRLLQFITEATAVRRVAVLQPAGGDGDKVFPPTYEKGQYAIEKRRVHQENGAPREVDCVLLDSVQSQANRMELALLRAWDGGRLPLPVIAVDFGGTGVEGVRRVTSLEAPHRLVDAILRDSTVDGKKSFPDYLAERGFGACGLGNASLLYELCPTALVFGMWDSTGRRGGLGVKFQRALVSEIVGIDVVIGRKTASRIDPLQIQAKAAELYVGKDGTWTLDEKLAIKEKAKPKRLGKDGKPSEANHGNVTPTIADGGATIGRALLTTVISVPALRRLSFPDADGRIDPERDEVAQAALLALGLAGATLADAAGHDLRSRCLLVPVEPVTWEVLGRPGTPPERFTLDTEAALELVREAAGKASKKGLVWAEREPKALGTLVLRPQDKLVTLVKASQALEVAVGEDS